MTKGKQTKYKRKPKKGYKSSGKKAYKKKDLMLSLPLGGLPLQNVVRFRYVATVRLDPAAGGSDNHKFLLNSIYDPDNTTTGDRPRWSDYWDPIYTKYTVLSARMNVSELSTLSQTDANASVPGNYFIYIASDRNETNLPHFDSTDPLTIAEVRGVKPIKSYGYPNVFVKGKGSGITKTRIMKKYFRTSDLVTNDGQGGVNNYSGLMGGLGVGSSPAYQCVGIIGAIGSNQASNPSPVQLRVTIDYITLLHDMVRPTQAP